VFSVISFEAGAVRYDIAVVIKSLLAAGVIAVRNDHCLQFRGCSCRCRR